MADVNNFLLVNLIMLISPDIYFKPVCRCVFSYSFYLKVPQQSNWLE